MRLIRHLPVLVLLLGSATPVAGSGPPLGTAFSYQGRIKQGGAVVNGTCDFQFKLYDESCQQEPCRGNLVAQTTINGVSVQNGLFTVDLDFGQGIFEGSALWLEIWAGCPSVPVRVLPRQPLTAAPYAIHALTGGEWTFVDGNPPAVTFDGFVGIASAAPAAALDVDGPNVDAGMTTGILKLGSAGTYLLMDSNEIDAAGGNLLLNSTSTGHVMLAMGGGNVGIGGGPSGSKLHVAGNICATGGVNCPSDARLKTNIERVRDPLAKVSALTGVTFEWIVDAFPKHNLGRGPQIGLIGQEVAEVLPEAVFQDDGGFYYVAYDQLVPVLVEAVKELREIAQANESRLADQRKLIDRQYELIQDLSGRLAAIESAVQSR